MTTEARLSMRLGEAISSQRAIRHFGSEPERSFGTVNMPHSTMLAFSSVTLITAMTIDARYDEVI